jgi:hypothetical protein
MAQPENRARCYNCNASLEQAPVTAERSGDPPTEKRARRPDLWGDAYTPRAELVPKVPASERPPIAATLPTGDAAMADEAVQLSRGAIPAPKAEAPATETTGDHAAPKHTGTGRILRGSTLAADADAFAPPPAKTRGRGSSGDPSEILGTRPTAKLKPVHVEGDGAPAPHANPPHANPPRRPSGERPIAHDPDAPQAHAATPASQAPLERKRTGHGIAIPTDLDAKPSAPPAAKAPDPSGKHHGETVILKPGETPAADEMSAAIQYANDAAKHRARLSPEEVANFVKAFQDEMADAPPEGPQVIAPEDDLAEPAPASGPGRPTLPPPGSSPHYLIAQVLGAPVELSPGEPVRIGRSETNEIVFPLTQISRVHAEVRFDSSAGAYVIVDRNSTNGTYVNNKPVRRRRLVDGDRISVGPFTLVYRATTGLAGATPRPRPSHEETEVVKQGALAGDLGEMPLPDVLRFIESLKKTGDVSILASTGERGTLFCRDGAIVHAEWRDQLGTQAALAILRVREGSFRFAAKPVAIDKPTVTATLAVLLKDALSGSSKD